MLRTNVDMFIHIHIFFNMELWDINIVLGSRKELPSRLRSSGLPDRNEYGGAGYELYFSSIWKTKLLNAKFVISVLKQNKNFTDMLNCYICNFHTFSKQSFRTHKILFHTGQLRQFNCSLCPFHSSFEGSVKNHQKNVHKKPYFDVWQNVEIIVEWLSSPKSKWKPKILNLKWQYNKVTSGPTVTKQSLTLKSISTIL